MTWNELKASEQQEFLLVILALIMVTLALNLALSVYKKHRKLKYYRVKYMFNNAPCVAVYKAYNQHDAAIMFMRDTSVYSYYKIFKGTETIDDFYKEYLRN